MIEPSVQVPVSLLRDALVSIECEDYDPLLVRRLEALIPQPNQSPNKKFREQYLHVPNEWRTPRIADMAPGTTFTAQVRFLIDSHGTSLPYTGFDPSTVRDVTPPK